MNTSMMIAVAMYLQASYFVQHCMFHSWFYMYVIYTRIVTIYPAGSSRH